MPLPYTGPHGELNFEADFISALQSAGWVEVLKNKTEKELIENWRKIISERNTGVLNGVPLSESEMSLVVSDMRNKVSLGPCSTNRYIIDSNITIRRDIDSLDTEHQGKDVILDIFQGPEAAGGTSRYQIVEQPIFERADDNHPDRRGDVMLLINGMPVIHIELKTAAAGIEEAYNQIKKYAGEGIFSGFFGLIQVFWCITPEDAYYLANPGEASKFNDKFRFHWGDEKNNLIKDWRQLITGKSHILSIPEAHKMIAYYCAADMGQNILLVCRSYQYHSIKKIVARTTKKECGTQDQKGGFCAVTTGGGKTLTTFKAGQMIVDFDLADKVVFVVDRDALNSQSLKEYNNFADERHKVIETPNTWSLYRKLTSIQSTDRLIMTTIQKLSRIKEDSTYGTPAAIEAINHKRIVFIFDEAHRSQAGDMHGDIKTTFPNALFFGFTGTPIISEDKKNVTTSEIFGNRLSFYSMAHGIRDGNIIGFLPNYISTYKATDLRKEMAKRECGVSDSSKIQPGTPNYKLWRSIMHRDALTKHDANGEIAKDSDGIPLIGYEDYFASSAYDNEEHQRKVVEDILENYDINQTGQNGTRFHGILATTSIEMACKYWDIFREENEKREQDGLEKIKVSAIFDANINENAKTTLDKEEYLIKIVDDYNKMFGTAFTRKSDPDFSSFKADLMDRIAHKGAYTHVADSDCLDIVIVVNQLLTGYDSKRVNILYFDKIAEEDGLIQAISRTNRIYNEEKPYGMIRFYRKPETMKRNLNEALRMYCEGDTEGVKAEEMDTLIDSMNNTFLLIKRVFDEEGIKDFETAPKDPARQKKFKKEFAELGRMLSVSRLQGYHLSDSIKGKTVIFTVTDLQRLQQRYLDLASASSGREPTLGVVFSMSTTLNALQGEMIDYDYLEKHFRLSLGIDDEETDEEKRKEALEALKKDLGTLSEKDQKIAREIISEIEAGTFDIEGVRSMRECIAKRREEKVAAAIKNLCDATGMNEALFSDYYRVCDSATVDLLKIKRVEDTADLRKVVEHFGCKNAMKGKSKLHEVMEEIFRKKNIEEYKD